jgi:hypothetical protein
MQISDQLQIIEKWNQKELRARIIGLFSYFKVDVKNDDSHKVSNTYFIWKLNGKTICSNAFADLHGIAIKTLHEYVLQYESPIEHSVHDAATRLLTEERREETEKARVKRFIETWVLSHTSSTIPNGKFLVLPIAHKEDLWKAATESEGFDLNHCPDNTFYTYWHQLFPLLVTRQSRGACNECLRLSELQQSNDKKIADDAAEQKRIHKKITEIQRTQSDDFALKAETNRDTILSLCCDYAASVFLPHKRVLSIKDDPHKKIKLHIGTYHDDGAKKPYYFLHHEIWNECSNTICSSLWKIVQRNRLQTMTKMYLSFDNHSTNKSNTVLCFLQHLTILAYFQAIELLFFIAEEGKNRADRDTSALHKATDREDYWTPASIAQKLAAHGKSSEWLQEVLDFDKYYADYCFDFPNIQKPHQ